MDDWTGLLGAGGITGASLGLYALKLSFDLMREKDKLLSEKDGRLAAQEASFRNKLEELSRSHAEHVKEIRDAHDRDLRESAAQQREQREHSEKLLERVLEKVGELAVFRAGARLRPPDGGGGAIPGPGNGADV